MAVFLFICIYLHFPGKRNGLFPNTKIPISIAGGGFCGKQERKKESRKNSRLYPEKKTGNQMVPVFVDYQSISSCSMAFSPVTLSPSLFAQLSVKNAKYDRGFSFLSRREQGRNPHRVEGMPIAIRYNGPSSND